MVLFMDVVLCSQVNECICGVLMFQIFSFIGYIDVEISSTYIPGHVGYCGHGPQNL